MADISSRAFDIGLLNGYVASVVKAHGGAFYLRSKAGWGTCAEVLLPLRPLVKGEEVA